jgi:hypothetical protein
VSSLACFGCGLETIDYVMAGARLRIRDVGTGTLEPPTHSSDSQQPSPVVFQPSCKRASVHVVRTHVHLARRTVLLCAVDRGRGARKLKYTSSTKGRRYNMTDS